MKRKFEIRYPVDHPDATLAGKRYKPKGLLVMSSDGIFYQITDFPPTYIYGPDVKLLSEVLPKYDVIWK